MKCTGVLVALTLAVILAGCDRGDPYVNEEARMIDQATVDAARTQPIDQAVINQHTLYSYHFIEGKDALNTLGCRDLRIIIEHYRQQGVPLNVQRQGEAQELYNARVRYVAKFIADCGVPDNRIQIVEGQPGGPGLPGYWVVKILSKHQPAQGTGGEEAKQGLYLAPVMGGGANQ